MLTLYRVACVTIIVLSVKNLIDGNGFIALLFNIQICQELIIINYCTVLMNDFSGKPWNFHDNQCACGVVCQHE